MRASSFVDWWEDLAKAEANISPESVEKIEKTIERSQAVLDQEMN